MKIQDIARQAGVSNATVSRVFNHHPSIRPEVREHVFAVARKNGYHPRLTAKQRNIVIITPYHPVYPVQSCVDMILMALTQEFPTRGFRLEIVPADNRQRLESIQFCAAVAIGSEPGEFADWPERFPAPLVVMDRRPGPFRPDVFYVRSDEVQGMRLAISHLHAHGCRRIGCVIHGEAGHGNTDLRREAVIAALQECGLPANDRLVLLAGNGQERYVELIGKLLKQEVDSLFCPGGNAGIVALYALSLFGREIPGEISLVASENTVFSRYAVPPQTTISPDYPGMAAAAAEIIEARLNGGEAAAETVLPYTLISRESVSALSCGC